MSCELEQLESCVCVSVCVSWLSHPTFLSLVSPRGIGTLQECKTWPPPVQCLCSGAWLLLTKTDCERLWAVLKGEKKLSWFLGRLSGLSTLLHIYLDTLIATEHGSSKELHELGSASWERFRLPRHIALESNGTLSGGTPSWLVEASETHHKWELAFSWSCSYKTEVDHEHRDWFLLCWCFVFWPWGIILL